MSTMGSQGASTEDMSMLDVRRSPMSAGQLGTSTLSMRAKAQRKRNANAQHNSNFRAGYVPVDEDVLLRTGIRGRKRYFLYCSLALLMVVSVFNALVTRWLVYTLGLSPFGLTSLEITSMEGRQFVRVLADATIHSMSFDQSGSLGARYNASLHLTASASQAQMGTAQSRISLLDDNIVFTTDTFQVQTNGSDQPLSLDLASLASQGIISNIFAENITVSQISSMPDVTDLYLESTVNEVTVEGSKGVHATTEKDVGVHGLSVHVTSKHGIMMDASEGLYFDSGLPRVIRSDPVNPDLLNYKVCVCKSGRLFVVPVTGPSVSCEIPALLPTLCS